MKCAICKKNIRPKKDRHCYFYVDKGPRTDANFGRGRKFYACEKCMDSPAWDKFHALKDALAQCNPKKGSLRAYLIPELVRLGAELVETHQYETFGGVYEVWEIQTGVGRLEIYPNDAYRSNVPNLRGRRGRVTAHIHTCFDDSDLSAEFQGFGEHHYHTGKWNWYEFDFATPADLGPGFIRNLEWAIAWKPTAEQLASAARRKVAYEARWGIRTGKSEVVA